MNTPPLLELRGISKRFPGVIALDNVALTIARGEVVALCGENGAGKSTLMKILGGVHQPDAGAVLLDGQPIKINNVSDAIKAGIAFIHQELNILDNLDVAGNVFLGREPLLGAPWTSSPPPLSPRSRGESRLVRRSFGGGGREGFLKSVLLPSLLRPFRLINRKKIHADTRPFLDRLGLNVSSWTRLDELSLAQQQMVEIAKALSMNARLIIMDEPTSSLTLAETDRLLNLVRELGQQGVSVIYISHRLGELEACASRVVVLRDGKNAGQLSTREISHDRIVSLMVGREIHSFYTRSAAPGTAARLKIRNLRTRRYPRREISFDAAGGEILGFAGLVGAGRSEMARALVGLDSSATGEITLGGVNIPPRDPRAALARGLYLVPEDRRGEGLVTEMNLRENITLPSLRRFAPFNFIRQSLERKVANEQIAALRIKTPGPESPVKNLSGGNQQKVVLGKWLSMQPEVMILDEPTRGIDVGAKAEIYKLMRALAEKGTVLLMISSDMEEILNVSDRVAVMHEGEIVGLLDRPDCTEQNIMQMAVGRKIAAARPPCAN